MDNSGLVSLILKVANKECNYTFESSKAEINLGYNVFVRKWALRLKELQEQDCEPVKQGVQSIPELQAYFDGELKAQKEKEEGHLFENPRKPKDMIDDSDFDFFSKMTNLRRNEITAAADSSGSGKTQDMGIELDFSEEDEEDGEKSLPSKIILDDLQGGGSGGAEEEKYKDLYSS